MRIDIHSMEEELTGVSSMQSRATGSYREEQSDAEKKLWQHHDVLEVINRCVDGIARL